MEFLFALFLDAVRGASRPRKRLSKHKLAELDEVMADPASALEQRTIYIGPLRHLVLSIFAIALLGLPGFAMVFGEPANAGNVRGPETKGERLVGMACLTFGLGIAAVAIYLSRGGSMMLTRDGVELRRGADVICCPWALFHSSGQSLDTGDGYSVVPVVAEAVPFVTWHKRGFFYANGARVRTKQLRFTCPDQAVLANFYEADLGAICPFLFSIGQTLGTTLPDAQVVSREGGQLEHDAPNSSSPLPDPRGWITLPLTKLRLPSNCSTCLLPTDTTFELVVFKPGHNRKSWLTLPVPFCQSCRRLANKWQYRFARRGILTGILAAAIIATTIDFNDPQALGGVVCVLGPAILLSGIVGLWIGEKRTMPARFRRYSPKTGTIAIWFRNPEYARMVVAAV